MKEPELDTNSPSQALRGQVADLNSLERTVYLFIAVLGDMAVIALFVIGGRQAHHDTGESILTAVGTAMPFLVGWFAASSLLGAFRHAAFAGYRSMAIRVVRSWTAGCILALVIRSVTEQHVVPLSFALVAFLFNAALLLLWRSALVTIVRRGRA